MANEDKKSTEKAAEETSCVNPALKRSTASVVSEPPLVPLRPTAESSSGSVASLKPTTSSPENVGAKFCQEPLLHSIVVQRYEGDMYGDLFHDEGTAYFQGGNVYKGMFSKGYMHGRGVYTWVDGVKYEGEFVLNVPTGYGKYTWLDGSWYEGQVRNGIRHGVGTYRCGTKCVSYCGQWHQGKRHGKGKIFYNQEMTSWYEGDWVNNMIDGWGVRRYSSGNVYEGQWKNNMKNGEGTMKWLTLAQQYCGHWENGIQHGQGTHSWFQRRTAGSQYPLQNEYSGEFVKGMRQGQGKFCYASGALYEGGWQGNKKHGQGKFTAKNGCIFEGDFVDDHMAEFPALSPEAVQTPALNTIRIHTPPSVNCDLPKENSGPSADLPLLSHDMALNIRTLLFQFPEQQRDAELRQMELAVLRYVAELRSTYCFYSRLGHTSPDNTFLLSRLQFWRLLKDCNVHQYGLTLAQMDRVISGDGAPKDIHYPFGTLLFRSFLSSIIILAYHIYQRAMPCSSNVLATCFSKLMKDNILPNARNVKGIIFSNPLHAVVASNYLMRCWEIYQYFCKLRSSTPHNLTLTMRHFIWIFKDLNLYDDRLTARKLLETLFAESLAVEDVSHRNLDLEMTFLEFFEALLGCAEVKCPWSVETPPNHTSELSRPVEMGAGPAPVRQELSHSPIHLLQFQDRSVLNSSIHSTTSVEDCTKSSESGKSRDVFHCSAFGEKAWEQGGLLARGLKAQTGSNLAQQVTETGRCLALLSLDTGSSERQERELPAGQECSCPARGTQMVEHGSLHPSGAEPAEDTGTDPQFEQNLWASRIHLFFSSTFFPAYECKLLLDKEGQSEQVRKGQEQVQSVAASTSLPGVSAVHYSSTHLQKHMVSNVPPVYKT